MRLLIDSQAARLFTLRAASTEYGDHRRYYCAGPPIRATVVCRNGLDLGELAGQVVDAQVGDDDGWRDFVRDGNAGRRHKKITIHRRVAGQAQATLSQVLAQAPKDHNHGR